jgi:hypothetical protein
MAKKSAPVEIQIDKFSVTIDAEMQDAVNAAGPWKVAGNHSDTNHPLFATAPAEKGGITLGSYILGVSSAVYVEHNPRRPFDYRKSQLKVSAFSAARHKPERVTA